MLDFLNTYNDINSNSLFFNFGNVEEDAHQLNVSADEISLQKEYIDGSKLKRYTMHIDTFKSITAIPVVTTLSAENVEDIQNVQKLLNWINEQGINHNFPDFGEDCIVEDMKVLSEKPYLLGVDDSIQPPMAVYRISVQIDYIDNTTKLWQN